MKTNEERYYNIYVWRSVEPQLHGPYKSPEERLEAAVQIMKTEDARLSDDTIFRLTIGPDGEPDVSPYAYVEIDARLQTVTTDESLASGNDLVKELTEMGSVTLPSGYTARTDALAEIIDHLEFMGPDAWKTVQELHQRLMGDGLVGAEYDDERDAFAPKTPQPGDGVHSDLLAVEELRAAQEGVTLRSVREMLTLLDEFDGWGMVATDEQLQVEGIRRMYGHLLSDDYDDEEDDEEEEGDDEEEQDDDEEEEDDDEEQEQEQDTDVSAECTDCGVESSGLAIKTLQFLHDKGVRLPEIYQENGIGYLLKNAPEEIVDFLGDSMGEDVFNAICEAEGTFKEIMVSALEGMIGDEGTEQGEMQSA